MFTMFDGLVSTARDNDYVIVDPPSEALTFERIDLEHPPKVSFCIPTLNSERTIGACLRSVVSQDYPDFEIIIVDGGSLDHTVDVARAYTDNIFLDEGPLGSARQTSIDHSNGTVLALFDDDTIIPHTRWLRNAVRYFNYSEKVSTVWPMMVSAPHAPLTGRLYANIWRVTFEDRILKSRGSFGGGHALFLREFIEEIGGVDQSLCWGEDWDWATKLKNRGYQVVYIKDPLYHDTMSSLREFAKKQFIGAETFAKDRFATTGLTPSDLFYEQFFLGTKEMTRGLVRDGDESWMLYPLFVLIRVIAYGSAYLRTL